MLIRRTLITLAAIATLTTAQACGPDFGADVFVRINRPDLPQQYVQGHLGILHADFPSADLFVAYRYLSGGALTTAEQKDAYTPVVENESPAQTDAPTSAIAAWMAQRAQYPAPPATPPGPDLQVKITDNGYTYNATVPNCAEDAFRTATGDQLLKLRRDTAALMRRYFAANPWTKKAAPFVGEVRPPAKS